MFRGISTINLDAKGRMAMPSRHRESLAALCGGRLVATIGILNRCLLLYPLTEWERIERDIQALPSFDHRAERIKHLLIGHAADLEPDGSGRLLLPRELREFAGLEKHVCLVGQGRKMEIWDQPAWDRQRAAWLDESADGPGLPDALRTLAL